MRVTLLLFAITVMTQCAITDVGNQIKDFFSGRQECQKTRNSKLLKLEGQNNRTVSGPRIIPSDSSETLTKQLRPHTDEDLEIKQGPKEMTMKSMNYGSKLNHPIFKTFSQRGSSGTMLKSDIAKQANKFLNDVARTKRQVLKDNIKLNSTWKDGVFYTFNTSDKVVQKIFKMGAKVWSDATCIDFIEDKNARDKVVVVKELAAYSDVGRIGGDQPLSLGVDLTKGSAVHEIGHVLGFFHTMERYDRDSYIVIAIHNVDPQHSTEFGKLRKKTANVYGLTYDYGSIMHYDELSGSINGLPTMIATNPYHQKTMGSELISYSDIFMINEHYGCNAICNKSTSAKCTNEGYPHPRNCSTCICPSGYGGTLCDRRPPGCGEDLVATSREQSLVYRLGFGSDLRDEFNFCNYMITAPQGKRIAVDVKSISHGYDEGGCRKGGVEIKAQADQKLTGYRFCSMKGTEGAVVSNSKVVPVILFNRLGIMQTIFTYRYID